VGLCVRVPAAQTVPRLRIVRQALETGLSESDYKPAHTDLAGARRCNGVQRLDGYAVVRHAEVAGDRLHLRWRMRWKIITDQTPTRSVSAGNLKGAATSAGTLARTVASVASYSLLGISVSSVSLDGFLFVITFLLKIRRPTENGT
jgi:hypothetical protein